MQGELFLLGHFICFVAISLGGEASGGRVSYDANEEMWSLCSDVLSKVEGEYAKTPILRCPSNTTPDSRWISHYG